MWPHLAMISGEEQIQTRVIRYPNTCVWKSISKRITVLERMFINNCPVLSSIFSCLETLMKHSPSFMKYYIINKLQHRKFFARNFIQFLQNLGKSLVCCTHALLWYRHGLAIVMPRYGATNKEALIMLCSVVKHTWSGLRVKVKHET